MNGKFNSFHVLIIFKIIILGFSSFLFEQFCKRHYHFEHRIFDVLSKCENWLFEFDFLVNTMYFSSAMKFRHSGIHKMFTFIF